MSVNGNAVVPRAFVWRRLHSLLGLMIVFYMVEHLIVNSQAALWIGDDGNGFVKLVNFIHSLPYLQVLEVTLIGVPIFFHGILGIKYALTSKGNSYPGKEKKPSLSFGRNIAFSWQRLTSWILIIGIIGHVVQMRFLQSPQKTVLYNETQYLVKLDFDEGLYSLSDRLNVKLFNKKEINSLAHETVNFNKKNNWPSSKAIPYNREEGIFFLERQSLFQEKKFIETLKSYSLSDTQVVAITKNTGEAFLLMVRDIFKNPVWGFLYSIFVIAAVFHGFNGLWTALITWGVILSYRSQKIMVNVALLLMFILGFLGLAAVWGTYFVNLRS